MSEYGQCAKAGWGFAVFKFLGLLFLVAALVMLGHRWIASVEEESRRLSDGQPTSWLDSAPEDQVEKELIRIVQGEEDFAILIQAMGSKRRYVAQMGGESLVELLDRWEDRDIQGELFRAKLALLAETLAEQVERMNDPSRTLAAKIVTRILTWPGSETWGNREVIVNWCEIVLRADPGRAPPVANRPLPWRQARAASPKEAPEGAGPSAASVASELPRLPGGGLPLVDGSLHERPATRRNPHDGTAMAPQRLAANPDARPINPAAVAMNSSLASSSTAPPLQPARADSESESAGPIRTASYLPAKRRATDGQAPDDSLVWMRRLRSTNEAEAVQAEKELIRRGFRPVELAIARRVFDPDPELRRELVHLLPSMAGIDAAPWLMRLASDEDADIRYLAVGALVTTGDPGILSQLEPITRDDSDPRIRHQVDEAVRRQRNIKH